MPAYILYDVCIQCMHHVGQSFSSDTLHLFKISRQLKTARGHMMPHQQHVYNGLVRPARRSDTGQRDIQRSVVKT